MEEPFLPAIECTWVNDDIQTQIHTAEPLVSEPRVFGFELAIEESKRQKSSDSDQIPSELIKTGGRTIRYRIHKVENKRPA